MSFNEKYNSIKNLVKDDFDILEKNINSIFEEKNDLNTHLAEFVKAPAKRLRPLIGFLFLRCLFTNISQAQYNILTAVELIHNATLIHDDVIDEADTRRGRKTINTKFDNNLAVIAGDFLLSIAMEKIISTNSIEVFKLCAKSLKLTCVGEINQYFNKFSVTSIDKYIEKSFEKTGFLFQMAVLGSLLISENQLSESSLQKATDFARDFAIAFQIRDDLLNVMNTETDINSGIYTAPVIFASEENNDILNNKDIINLVKNSSGIEKTKNLMDNYFNKAISDINDFEENIYKKGLLELVEAFRNN